MSVPDMPPCRFCGSTDRMKSEHRYLEPNRRATDEEL